MIKLETLSKLLTESTYQKSSSQRYICEASKAKMAKETIELAEKLIRSGKTDDALNMIRKVKLDKVSLLSKMWNTLPTSVRKLWTNTKKVAKVAIGAAAGYGGYQIAKNIAGDDNKKDDKDDKDTISQDDTKKSDDRFNQPYDKIIATEPVYIMTRRHGQVFDDDDTKIKTMKEQEEELKQKEKEENQEIKIDLNNIYDEQGNQIHDPYSSSPSFSFGKFIDKADNAFYDVGHALGGALQGGISSIKDDAVDVYDTFKDTVTGKYGSEEENNHVYL